MYVCKYMYVYKYLYAILDRMHSYNLNIVWMDGVVLVVDVDVVAVVVGRYQFELRVQCIASMLFSASTECERGLEN